MLVSADPPDNRAGWQHDPRVNAWTAPAIVNFRDPALNVDLALPQIQWPADNVADLRPDQTEAVDAWTALRKGQIIAPTGTGKTVVALEIMRQTGVPTLVVAPVRDLMYQWQRRIASALGYEAGIIGDHTHDLRPVTCTTYASAAIHGAALGDQFRLVIYDEVHHLPGETYAESALFSAAPWRLGLTATPERADGRHERLDDLVGPVCFRQSISEVRGTVIADYDVERISVYLPDALQAEYDRLGGVIRRYFYDRRRRDPGFDMRRLCACSVADPDARAAMRAWWRRREIENSCPEKLRVVEDLFLLHRGEPTIVFTGSNAMALDVSLRFLIPPLLSHCGRGERAEILERFADGRYPAIVANRVIDEGVDLPCAKVGIVLGGQGSIRQATQRLGRVLRKQNERRAILYEIVCADTAEVQRSRKRRSSDAYAGKRHRRH